MICKVHYLIRWYRIMQSDNHFFNDFTKVITGFLGTAQGLQKEAYDQFKRYVENIILDAGFVRQKEHDLLEMRLQELTERFEEIEKKISFDSNIPKI